MRSLRLAVVFSTISLAFAINANGQSVVQLPTFETFRYSGTVLVPDGGTTSLGGVRRSAMSSSRSGLSRRYRSSHSHPHATVTATIIDLKEMDRQILGGTPEQFMQTQRGVRQVANGRQPNQRSTRPIDADAEGKSLVRFARRKYREGDHGAAFEAYQIAIERLSPYLRRRASDEFRRVFGSSADQALQMASLGQ